MNSREKILQSVRNNQPPSRELPTLPFEEAPSPGLCLVGGPAENFISVLESIGGAVYIVQSFEAIRKIIKENFAGAKRIVSSCPELESVAETNIRYEDVHSFADIDLAVIRAHFGVAENGACWVTEDLLIERALPFICQHLAIVLDCRDIVADMHEAYRRIAAADYGFGSFIAGPSKTADIEQSLVLGAHGPRSMTVFLLDSDVADLGFF